MTTCEFPAFAKIPRFNRAITITEKIDGTNGLISIDLQGRVRAGSRNRWVTSEDDNFGFAKWVKSKEDELIEKLGFGHHYGEWWGAGVGRRYDMKVKVFSLFNSKRWLFAELPEGVRCVPILFDGIPESSNNDWSAISEVVSDSLNALVEGGSVASPGFMKPEGIIIYHSAADQYFKVTIEKDAEYKGKK